MDEVFYKIMGKRVLLIFRTFSIVKGTYARLKHFVFLLNTDSKIGILLLSYAWKIEYGEDKGIHYHVILFFNGNRVQKDYYYADELGKLWLEITQGYGVYFNCSSDKLSRYGVNNALKVTHRLEDRTNLYQATKYLTKIDANEYEVRALSNGRLFGKSCC